jgi:hypothetical protein
MSTQPGETFQSPLAAAKRWTRRASDGTKRIFSRRKGASGPSEGDGTSLGVFDGTSATSLGRHDETTPTHPSEKSERETTVAILKEDETVPSTPSMEVNSATRLSQEDRTVQREHSSVEYIQTVPLREDEIAVDSHPPDKDNESTSSQTVIAAQPSESTEDDSACEHAVFYVPGYWR